MSFYWKSAWKRLFCGIIILFNTQNQETMPSFDKGKFFHHNDALAQNSTIATANLHGLKFQFIPCAIYWNLALYDFKTHYII